MTWENIDGIFLPIIDVVAVILISSLWLIAQKIGSHDI